MSFQEKDKKYMFALDGLKLKDAEQGFLGKKCGFALFSGENR